MRDMTATLARKGWGRVEISRVSDILAHAEASKSTGMRFLESTAFWVALLVAILGNFIVSVVLVPFLLLLKGASLYFTVFVIGIAFGALFSVLIRYVEDLRQGQHIIAGIFIPVLALINIYLIVYFSNKLEILLQLPVSPHSPAAVSMVYVFAFVLPYFIKHMEHVRKKRL